MQDEDHNYNQHNTVVIRWPRSSDHPAGLTGNSMPTSIS